MMIMIFHPNISIYLHNYLFIFYPFIYHFNLASITVIHLSLSMRYSRSYYVNPYRDAIYQSIHLSNLSYISYLSIHLSYIYLSIIHIYLSIYHLSFLCIYHISLSYLTIISMWQTMWEVVILEQMQLLDGKRKVSSS
jgi:hypothetical protein